MVDSGRTTDGRTTDGQDARAKALLRLTQSSRAKITLIRLIISKEILLTTDERRTDDEQMTTDDERPRDDRNFPTKLFLKCLCGDQHKTIGRDFEF